MTSPIIPLGSIKPGAYPWTVKQTPGAPFPGSVAIVDALDRPVGVSTPDFAPIIVACVNALAGIPDPAAALQAARDALRQAEEALGNHWFTSDEDDSYNNEEVIAASEVVAKALALLTPKEKQ